MSSRGNLRHGWCWVKFGEVVRLSRERSQKPLDDGFERYVGLEHLDPEDLRVRRWGDIADGTTFTNLFRAGQVLFGKRRAYQRKVGVADFAGVCSGDIYVLESANAATLLPELLPFLCQTDAFFEYAVGTSAGSLSPRTNWNSLAAFEFALPPLDAQRRMVEALSAADHARVSTEQCVEHARLLLAAAMDHAWSEGCPRTALGDLAVSITSGSRGWAAHYAEDGRAKFLRIGNLRRGSIHLDSSDLQRVEPPSTLEAERTRVRTGDLLLSVTAELGLVAVAPRNLGEAYVNQHIALIHVDPTKVDPHYVAWFLCSRAGQRQIQRFNDAGAKAGMNLPAVAGLQIPLCEPEQQLVIRDRLASLENAQTKLLAEAQDLREIGVALLKSVMES